MFWDTASGPVAPDPRSVVICTQDTDEVDGTKILRVDDERSLIIKLRGLIKQHDPDILTGYNLSFDNKFLDKRSKTMPGMQDLETLGRIDGSRSYFQMKEMNNSAMGNNELVLWHMPGRFVLDLFIFAKQNYMSEPSYKLDALGQKYVAAGKDPIVFGTILESFGPNGTPALRGEVGKYWYVPFVEDGLVHMTCRYLLT